jgi:Gas vesicle synthesis protein GvpL/GvpF
MTSRPTGTYVYCVLAARKLPRLSRALAGPPGTARPRLIEIKPGRYLVVSDAPLDRFGEEQIAALLEDLRWVSRSAVAHESVITSLLPAVDAVVPMKLFTIFASDDRAVARTLDDWKRIDRALGRVAQHVEWGVRLSLDERTRPAAKTAGPATSGLGYLRAKKQIQIGAVQRARSLQRRVASALRALSAVASETRRRDIAEPADGRRRLVLDAAFLVPRRRAAGFRAAVKRQARALAPSGYRIQLTGPWPPYSFVEDRV